LDTSLEPMRPDTPLSVLTRSFAAYNLVALPVVDETGSLVGAVTFDDLVDHMLPQGWRELPDGWGHDDPVVHRG
jgi:Mg/Co/Ni transporter MgtE